MLERHYFISLCILFLLWGSLSVCLAQNGALAHKMLDKREGQSARPKRIVSLNLCTDQILMMLVKPSRIMALSPYARQASQSIMAAQAQKIPLTFGSAEEVTLLKPDLVLAGTFTARATVNLLRKLGHRLLEFAPASNFEHIIRNIRMLAKAVHEEKKGQQIIAKFMAQLEVTTLSDTGKSAMAALYYANGYSAGLKTLVDATVRKGGFSTLGQKLKFRGIQKISLENFILSRPDILVFGHKKYPGEAMAYEIFKHPAMIYLKQKTKIISIADALTICGTPHTIKAVQQLQRFRKAQDTGR